MALPPADGDYDGDVAEEHHQDGQEPRENKEVDEVDKLLLLIPQRYRVDALSEEIKSILFLFYQTISCDKETKNRIMLRLLTNQMSLQQSQD